MSHRKLDEESGVSRATIARIEADDPAVEDLTRARLFAALARLEHRFGLDDPDQVVSVLDLGDGTRVTFTGSPEGVAEAAQRFLAERKP